MAKSKKPKKPYKDFPLSAASNGQWCKKVRGRIHYFGVWSEPDKALKSWIKVKDRLLAGLSAPKNEIEGITFRKLANTCLTTKKKEAELKPRKKRHFRDCLAVAELCKGWKPVDFPVDGLAPQDFVELKSILAKSRKIGQKSVGDRTLHNRMSKVTLFLNFGRKNRLFTSHVDDLLGTCFDVPTTVDLEREKNANPEKLFEPEEIKRLIVSATGTLRTCILLSINCGFGATDIGDLERKHIDGDFIRLPRGKTSKKRAAWLWPETQEALRGSMELAEKHSPTLCVTTKYGNSVAPRYSENDTLHDPMSSPFYRLRKQLKCFRTGVGLYSLRHSFQTIADETELAIAMQFAMGHEDESMSGSYHHLVSDENIKRVCEHVRKRILG